MDPATRLWTPDAPAVRRPAAPALTLPQFAPEIPTEYRTETRDVALFTIAEGLLAEGILEEDDWEEEIGLTGSIIQGLRRFVLEENAGELEYFRLELGFTNDVGHWSVYGYDREEQRRGGLALLTSTEVQVAEVGEIIGRIEQLAKGAGYAVMAVLQGALHQFEGWTPAWAFDDLSNNLEMEMEESDENGQPKLPDDFEGLTIEEFYDTCPQEAVFARWNQRAFNRAMKRAPSARDSVETMALYLAGEIKETLQQWDAECGQGRFDRNENHDMQCPCIPSVILRWQQDDEIVRLFDDYAEMVSQGEYTNVAWLKSFTLCADETQAATRSLRYVVKLIRSVDALLSCLDTSDNRRTCEERFSRE